MQANWIAFASDGASVILGKKNGVATRLVAVYPRVFVWQCMNHRLELAFGDAVDDVANVNHFKHCMDSLYALYSMSSKNKRELSAECAELDLVCENWAST